MTERNSITTEKLSSSRQAASGSAVKAGRRSGINSVSTEERERMIAVKAYYCAERRGFAPGHELEDWCEAEMEINRQLGRE
ncbi:hypothetical protein SCL_0980 [Sulfuricaulis limicola]|uniref:DUF2934 domain-containing protein n=1 Tax=Sulfuricaulis limicola TaxID=1620215 RepID=A0A1B4XES0_9GAMM|nr:DUF2934 domain-containing protein [Sulfuricaulis limicola]BAV33296.1 hypothetical protein SCL_0980 [Sulfuricaulis limicola]